MTAELPSLSPEQLLFSSVKEKKERERKSKKPWRAGKWGLGGGGEDTMRLHPVSNKAES